MNVDVKTLKKQIKNVEEMAERGIIDVFEAEKKMQQLIELAYETVPYGDYDAWIEYKKIKRHVWRWLLNVTK